ncbi:hypothetical protein UlMin_033202 [Ulmus minor]
MVKANDSWLSSQQSSRQLPSLNCMSMFLDTRQQKCLPSLTNQCTGMFSVPMELPIPGSGDPYFQSAKTEQINETCGSLHCLPIEIQATLPSPKPCINGMDVPNANFLGSCQKGFLIFDQSENQTRLIYSYICPPVQNTSIANSKPVSGYVDLHKVGHVGIMNQVDPTNINLHEMSGENRVTGEHSEMHEDTEEINALLYSEDEDDSDSYYGQDDEVMSTGHSPIKVKEDCGKREQVEELTEEVASSNAIKKKRKMLDGGYHKSSPTYTASSVKLDGRYEYDNDAKSGYADDGLTKGEGSDCILDNMRDKRDKVRKILRILESIIPGVKGKDPLLVIDEAIDYLKITKLKAETLGASFH